MVPQVAVANCVCLSAIRRSASSEPQAELVGAHGCRGGAIGEQIELLLLDAVLDLTAGAVDVLVKCAGVDRAGRQRGDDEARVGAFGQMLGLGHDAALP